MKELSLQAPLLLKKRGVIAGTFDVDQETVTAWAREGAPIFIAGNKYQADYRDMVDWLVKNKPVWKNLSSPQK